MRSRPTAKSPARFTTSGEGVRIGPFQARSTVANGRRSTGRSTGLIERGPKRSEGTAQRADRNAGQRVRPVLAVEGQRPDEEEVDGFKSIQAHSKSPGYGLEAARRVTNTVARSGNAVARQGRPQTGGVGVEKEMVNEHG
jgi:hypothetical protein